MDFTPGEMMFYGGLALGALDLIVMLILAVGKAVSSRKLEKQLNQEYFQ